MSKFIFAILFLMFLVRPSDLYAQRQTQHEIGVNLIKGFQYDQSVWDEKGSFLQVFSPITYKLFINDSSAIRAAFQYSDNAWTHNFSHAFRDHRAKFLSFSFGYQRIFGKRKLKPFLFSDLAFVSEDYYDFGVWGYTVDSELQDFTSNGFCLNGGVGVRYEFSQKFCLAYEANLGLYMRQVNGQEYTFTRYPEESYNRTTWSDAILTNWVVNPISNLSVNFRF